MNGEGHIDLAVLRVSGECAEVELIRQRRRVGQALVFAFDKVLHHGQHVALCRPNFAESRRQGYGISVRSHKLLIVRVGILRLEIHLHGIAARIDDLHPDGLRKRVTGHGVFHVRKQVGIAFRDPVAILVAVGVFLAVLEAEGLRCGIEHHSRHRVERPGRSRGAQRQNTRQHGEHKNFFLRHAPSPHACVALATSLFLYWIASASTVSFTVLPA